MKYTRKQILESMLDDDYDATEAMLKENQRAVVNFGCRCIAYCAAVLAIILIFG